MSESVSVVVCVGDSEIEGSGKTLRDALADVALRADVRALELEAEAQLLRVTAARYRGAASVVDITGVGGPAGASHQNDNEDEGEDDGRTDDDFEVGEKG